MLRLSFFTFALRHTPEHDIMSAKAKVSIRKMSDDNE